MCGAEQTTTQAALMLSFMRERPQFPYLSAEAFCKLTRLQKQEYVVVLKNHLDVPIRDDTADQSFQLRPPARDLSPS
jgi:hypothetical protein